MRRCFLVAAAVLGGIASVLGGTPSPSPSPSVSPAPKAPGSPPFILPADSSHSVRLNFPFSWIGELKLPTKDELTSRDKLESLACLTDLEIRSDLEKWAPYNSMSLSDQGKMLQKIQDFRDRRNKLAQDEAQRLGLANLSPTDLQAFTQLFWQRRLRADQELLAEFQPEYDAKQTAIDHELQQTFSSRVPTNKPSPVPTPKPAANTTTPAPPKLSPAPSKPPTSTTSAPPKPAPASTSLVPSPKPTPAPKPTPSKSPK